MTVRQRTLGQGKFFSKNLYLSHIGSIQYLSHTCSAFLKTRKLSMMPIGQLDGKNWLRQRVQHTRNFWRRKKKRRKKKKKVTAKANSIKDESLPAAVRGRGRGLGRHHGRGKGSIDAPKL